jgi:hypothetical protein
VALTATGRLGEPGQRVTVVRSYGAGRR